MYDDLTVAENLRFFARVLGVDQREVDRVVAAVDLSERRGQVVGRLSGGQRSRVSLAVALLGEPDLLVLDEPTVGLDPVLREDLWALFHQLADDGTAVFVSSHVMDEAERCHRLLLMRDGRVIADGSPDEIKEEGRRRNRRGRRSSPSCTRARHEPRASPPPSPAGCSPSSAATTARSRCSSCCRAC